jgi:beta-lactamase regulating signal transducer with metallopeptidase domain/ankyrin repeat protein
MNSDASAILKPLLEASWQASLVIVLILLLRPLLGWRVPARWRSLLWTLVLLRLLVPAFLLPPSPASLQNIAAVDRPFEQAAFAMATPSVREAMPASFRSQGPGSDDTLSAPVEASKAAASPRSWWRMAMVVWFSGAGLAAAWIFAATIHLRRRVWRDATPAAEWIEEVWQRCCERGTRIRPRGRAPRRWPRLAQTGAVSSPALIGVFRPALLIPRRGCEQLSAADWEHVFLHELAHFRRRDHWMQALHLIALCAHWFNPLVWLGFRYLRADRELAADEWALRHLEDRRAVAYGDTLLKVLTAHSRSGLTPGLVGIMEDAAQMKQRLRHIVAFAPRRVLGSVAGIVIVLALGAVVLGRPAADLSAYEGLAPAESLVVAARSADKKAVEQLLADGVDVNGVANIRGERTALTAAVAGHAEEIIRLLVAKGADVNLKPEKADAPIIVALKKGWMDTAEFLRSRGATCDPETLAAANGDVAAVQTYLASGTPPFDKLKLLVEVAAAHGHAALFATLYDAVRSHPEAPVYWTASGGTLITAVARGQRGVIEEMIKRDINLRRSGVIRLGAAATQSPGMRAWLQSKGFDVPEYTDGERLIDAAEREDLPEIRRVLKAGVDVNYRGESDWTPIAKAATWGCPKAVKLLLENRADPNIRKHSYTPLALAKTPEIADLLFAAGADVNAKLFERDVHIISYCVSQGSKEMVQWFFDHGVDPTRVKDDEPTLLFSARSPEVVEMLVARGVDVHARDDGEQTALIRAMHTTENAAPVVAALLKHGADPNVRMSCGSTPLMAAPDAACVDLLVAAGADLRARNRSGQDVLSVYTALARPSRLEALRRHGLQPDRDQGAAQLVNAIRRQAVGEVQALLQSGVDPHTGLLFRGRRIGSPLSVAVEDGEFEIAALLRAAGAKDVGLLSEAAARGDLAQMEARIAGGAAVDERSGTGMTPLRFAVERGQSAAVKLLLNRGANVNRCDNRGLTAYAQARLFHQQIERESWSPVRGMEAPEAKLAIEEIIALLEARKPDINFRDEAGETALHRIADAGISTWLPLALEDGANVNAQRPDGMTALMLAISGQPKIVARQEDGSGKATDSEGIMQRELSFRGDVVKWLLHKGADLNLRNKAGKTALDLARENGNAEILALLEEATR